MLDTYREMIDLLVATPNALREATDNAKEPPPGEWDAAQVLAHMAAAEQLWLDRLNVMVHQRDALLKSGGAAYFELQERLMPGDAESNLAEFNNRRGETISLMMGLSLNDWSRTAIHESLGEMSVEDVVEGIIDHDNEHVAQLRALAS